MALDRTAILGAEDLGREEVQAPEWGGSVFVKVLSGTERDALENRLSLARGADGRIENLRAHVAAATVCDESGQPLFAEADVAALGRKNAKALDRIFDVARRINALFADGAEEAKKG